MDVGLAHLHALGTNEDLTENFCTNNENVEQFLKLIEQERQGQKPQGEKPAEP